MGQLTDRQGLPVGPQIVGPRFADARVLALAAIVERETQPSFRAPHPPRTEAGRQ